MNMDRWNQEDRELQQEFEDVSKAWKASADPVKKIPSPIDRLLRKQAQYQAGDQLKESWIFGNIPLVSLAACLFFSLSLYFIVSLEHAREDQNEEQIAEPPSILGADEYKNGRLGLTELKQNGGRGQSLEPTKRLHPRGWIKLTFRVDKYGKADDVEIVDRCLTFEISSACDSLKAGSEQFDQMLLDSIDRSAVDRLMKKRYPQFSQPAQPSQSSGRIEEVMEID